MWCTTKKCHLQFNHSARSGMFSLLASLGGLTLTPLQSGMHMGKLSILKVGCSTLGPLWSLTILRPTSLHIPAWSTTTIGFQLSVINLVWFNSYQSNTRFFWFFIFQPPATHVPSFVVDKTKVGKKDLLRVFIFAVGATMFWERTPPSDFHCHGPPEDFGCEIGNASCPAIRSI